MLCWYVSIVDSSHSRDLFMIVSVSSLAFLISYRCDFVYTWDMVHVKVNVRVKTVVQVLMGFLFEHLKAVFEVTVEIENSWLPIVA